MKKFLNRLVKDERGLSFVIVSVGMMALVGMAALVSDFGRVALVRQELVNAVDSSAVAGAQELVLNSDPSLRELAASQAAEAVAAANGAPAETVTVSIDGGKVSVDAERNVDLILSRAFGVNTRNVRAHAAAVTGAVTSYTGIAPICVKEQAFTYGQLYTLKFGSPDTSGNFGALALAGRGASTYRDNLINGFGQPVSLGETLTTEPGNMNNPTDGIDQRLALCTDGCTFDNFRPGCPRVIVIPMHNNDLQGRTSITVTGFAAFFVDRDSTISGSDEIKGYFVRMAGEGDIDPTAAVTSLYGVKLVE